jgi:hypothetical protein
MAYEDLSELRPCERCRSRKFWFDGDEWQCLVCVPPSVQNTITVELNPETQGQGAPTKLPARSTYLQ